MKLKHVVVLYTDKKDCTAVLTLTDDGWLCDKVVLVILNQKYRQNTADDIDNYYFSGATKKILK